MAAVKTDGIESVGNAERERGRERGRERAKERRWKDGKIFVFSSLTFLYSAVSRNHTQSIS
jgi:hypothetical protein